MEVTITGQSDDIIDCTGNAKGCDEYSGDQGVLLLLPSGDRFAVKYGLGNKAVWKVVHEHDSGKLNVVITEPVQFLGGSAVVEDDYDDDTIYTDTCVAEGLIERVQFWKTWPPSQDQIQGRVKEFIENGMEPKEWERVWMALGSP